MSKNPIPSVEVLNKFFVADFDLGKLFWKARTPDMFPPHQGERSVFAKDAAWKCNAWNAKNSGKEAFTSVSNTYKAGTINKASYKAHRILFKMYHGYDPDEVDHIDGDPFNNRISNLREVSRMENMKNVAKQYNNTSGVSGVCWDKSRSKWSARIECEKKIYHLGRFDLFEDACNARFAAEKRLGFHANHSKRDSIISSYTKQRKEKLNSKVSRHEDFEEPARQA